MKTLVCFFVLLTAHLSAATVTVYSSRASFEGALPAFDTWDFTGADGTSVPVLNALGVDIANISTQGGDAAGKLYGNALCGQSSGLVDCFNPLVFTFLQPRNSFGYDNLDFNSTEEAVVTLTFAGGSPSQQFVFDLAGAPVFSPVFFGITSDENLASVIIYSRTPGTTSVGARANVVDNVTIGLTRTAAVPEPGTFAALGLGLATLLGLARRRTSRA